MRKAVPAAVHLGADVVAPHVSSYVPDGRPPAELVRVAHEAGLQVLAWCPEHEEIDRFTAAGVDCVIVDDAPAAVAR
jgi:glycerophosphoryl diester phosphodiesterase